MCQKLKKVNSNSLKKNFFGNINEDKCYILTGIKKEDFEDLYLSIHNSDWKSQISIKDSLGFYLVKLRLGLSIRKLLALIHIGSYAI